MQLRQLALIGLAYHNGGIDRGNGRAHVVGEFDRTRTVDKGIGFAHEAGGGRGQPDAHLVLACFGTGIADAGSLIDAACFGDCARSGKDGLKKCGFPALERAHQRNAPGTRCLGALGGSLWTSEVWSHCRLLIWKSAHDWVGTMMLLPRPGFGKRENIVRQGEAYNRGFNHCEGADPDSPKVVNALDAIPARRDQPQC